MGNPNEYDHDEFPDFHRPTLTPSDPRATASGNPSFDIHGSIDNESCFDIGSGQSKRAPH